MERRIPCVLICVVAACLLSGCGSVPLGHTYHRVDAVPQGKAVVYLFRPSLSYEYGVVFPVAANGVPVVGLADGSYYPYFADPGMATFTSARTGEKTAELQVLLEAGKSCYVQLVPVRGIFRCRAELTQFHEQAAEPMITGCRLVLTTQPHP